MIKTHNTESSGYADPIDDPLILACMEWQRSDPPTSVLIRRRIVSTDLTVKMASPETIREATVLRRRVMRYVLAAGGGFHVDTSARFLQNQEAAPKQAAPKS